MNPHFEKQRAIGFASPRCKDGPDYSGMNRAAEANSEIAKESLEWYKAEYARQEPLRQQAAARAFEISDAQLGSMKQNDAISRDYWDYQKSTFRPLEQGIVNDAQAYDTEARREAKAAGAIADVGMQANLARDAQDRDLARRGVAPGSGAALALGNQMAMSEAAAKAGAANTARDGVELQGYARRMDAANLGRGLASSQATSAGVALNAGNSAAQTGQMPLTQAQGSASMMGQGFGTAIQGNQSAGNIYGQVAQMQSQDNGAWGALGSVAGQFAGSKARSALIAGWMSDEKKKKNVKPMSDDAALKAVEKTPVSKWTYKEGEGDGGSHIGPMAQQVRKTMGESAAPGGKVIDPITMNGITMAGMAALSRKVDKLTKKVEGAAA